MINACYLKKVCMVIGFGLSVLFLYATAGVADIVTSNLTISPTPCKPGDVLTFKAAVFNHPDVGTAPGTAYYGAVVLDTTNSPELLPWHSELQVFKYPYPDKESIIHFTTTYLVPENAKNTLCFYVTEGQQMSNRISYKHCIQVRHLVPQLKKEPVLIPLRKPDIIVDSFAYMPAPLKEGNNIDMFITFKNKGLGKSPGTSKYTISCLVLSGGGADKNCPVPSVERTFGKDILPGESLSVSLLGATPAKAGSYKITIGIPGQKTRPYSITLNVAPKLKLQRAPVSPTN